MMRWWLSAALLGCACQGPARTFVQTDAAVDASIDAPSATADGAVVDAAADDALSPDAEDAAAGDAAAADATGGDAAAGDAAAEDAAAGDAAAEDAAAGDAAAEDAAAVTDAPTVDAPTDAMPLDAPSTPTTDWCARVGHPVEPLSESVTVVTTSERVEYVPGWDVDIALRTLTTPVPLTSVTFDLSPGDNLQDATVTAGCGGPATLVMASRSRTYLSEAPPVRWFEGTGHDLAPGTYVLVMTLPWGSNLGWQVRAEVHGTIAHGAACTDPLVAAGVLGCAATDACVAGVCVTAACSDGIDDDGDGLADAADPGCSASDDTDEADPCPGPGCPACGDGVDDDGDGAIDTADPGCTRAGDPDERDCEDPNPIVEIDPVLGAVLGPRADVARRCLRLAFSGPESMLHIDLPVPTRLRFGYPMDSAWYAVYRDTCQGEAIECVFPSPEGPLSATFPAGHYYIAAYGSAARAPISVP